MNIEGKGYKIGFDGRGTLAMSGNIAVTPDEYEEIEDYFEKVLDAISETDITELTFDLRNLKFLNSSGIKTICVSLVMEVDDTDGLHMKILCNNSVSWQVETIPTFKELIDDLEVVFE